MIYLAKKGNEAVFHTSLQAMYDYDGVIPELTVSEEEFEAAGSLVRVIDERLVLGKTKTEKAADRLRVIDAELAAIDAKSGRPSRAVATAVAKGAQSDPADVARLDEYEARAEALHRELTELKSGVAG